ncbi:MAG: signal peptidase II [Planctomycetes bacterium]|nr:signal peptidase II [Planctomycetota bacterium]
MSDAPEVAEADEALAEPGDVAEPKSLAGKLWFWLPWPLLVVADLWSKSAVFSFMAERYPLLPEERRPPYVVWDGALRFDLVTWGNTGTIWGLFQDGTVVLMVLRCFALVGLLWFVRSTSRRARLQLLVLSLVFAGAVGNLYDNFVRDDRSVRDFLHFSGTWPWRWDFPAFNVADSCITIGAIGLFLLLWRDDRAPKKKPVS